MPHTKKYVVVAVAVAATALGTGTALAAGGHNSDPVSERRAEQRYTDAHRSEARVTQAEAARSGQVVRPGSVVESHLETEGTGLRWEIKTDDATHIWEVQLDPSTGAVVSNHSEK